MRPAAALPVLIALVAGGCTATSTAIQPTGTGTSSSAAPHPSVASTPAQTPSQTMRVAVPAERKPFISPIQPDNRPSVVAGDTNGMMPARDLVGVARNCLAARAAAPSLGLLLATARDEGVVLHTEQCYRPLSDQVTVKQRWSAAGHSACAAPVLTTSSGKPKGTSMHGWGKAADLSDAGGTVRFGSPGYEFLTAQAARFGWNHPAWARPGGSTCPEAWHWEWVGDGGILHDSPIRADVVTLLPTWDGLGYSIVTGLGAVLPHGDSTDRGSLARSRLAWLVVGASRTPSGGGYWLVGLDGSVHAFGDAPNFGSTASHPPAQPVVGMASANGAGYWLATTDGQVFGFGAATTYGSPAASGLSLARPIVAIAATPDGRGYWLAGSDGKVFAYGDAAFYGGMSRRSLKAPVVSVAATPDGRGYWLTGADGSVHAFGDARSFGSIPHRIALREPVMAMAATPDGEGYWLVAADGSVFAFGDASLHGVARGAHMVPRHKWPQ
jgi:hypothetical protein